MCKTRFESIVKQWGGEIHRELAKRRRIAEEGDYKSRGIVRDRKPKHFRFCAPCDLRTLYLNLHQCLQKPHVISLRIFLQHRVFPRVAKYNLPPFLHVKYNLHRSTVRNNHSRAVTEMQLPCFLRLVTQRGVI